MYVYNIHFFKIYLFLRSGNRGSKAGSVLTAVSLMQGSNSGTVRSWPEAKSDTQLTEPLRCPWLNLIWENPNRLGWESYSSRDLWLCLLGTSLQIVESNPIIANSQNSFSKFVFIFLLTVSTYNQDTQTGSFARVGRFSMEWLVQPLLDIVSHPPYFCSW